MKERLAGEAHGWADRFPAFARKFAVALKDVNTVAARSQHCTNARVWSMVQHIATRCSSPLSSLWCVLTTRRMPFFMFLASMCCMDALTSKWSNLARILQVQS